MRSYEQITEELKQVLNTNFDKDIGNHFKELLQELKQGYFISVDMKFLKNLIDSSDKKQKSNRVLYILNKAGLKIRQTAVLNKEWIFQKYKTEIIVYHNNPNKKVYSDELVLNSCDDDKGSLLKAGFTDEEIKLLSEDSKKLIIQQERQNTRNAINKTGKPFIKEVKNINVGKSFIGNVVKIHNIIEI